MPSVAPIRTDLVLLGAGRAHVEVLRRFAQRPEPGVRLTLVSRELEALYPRMLPGLIRGDYAVEQAHIELAPLAAAAGARLILADATALDLAERQIGFPGRPPLPYDLLSIDVGVRSAIPEGSEGIPVKPTGRLRERLVDLAERLGPGERVAVIGGGPAGCELALALRRGLRGRARIVLVSETTEPVAQAPAYARRIVRAALVDAGVELISGVHAVGLAARRLFLSDGSAVEVAAALWATGVAGPAFLAQSGLACDAVGRVRVDASLHAVGRPDVFAVGECAAPDGADLREFDRVAGAGRLLADNLRRAARGRGLRRCRPRSETLTVLELGDGRAVACYRGLAVAGRLVWRCKDRIDRRWIGMYQRPKRHSDRQAAKDLGGAQVLDRVLAGLEAPNDPAVLLPPPGQAVVQSFAQLHAMIDDPFVSGQVAAVHALSDMHAMGARPQSALAIAGVPADAGERMRADLSAMLQGAAAALQAEGCTLAGGHSREAPALALGFAVAGLVDPKRLRRKSGLRLGDALVLTKRLGTGIVLAGHMRGEARSAWLLAALESMRASNAPAAAVLRDHAVTACTAVTGFGLAGHLLAMLRASQVAAVLSPGAVPALPGAAELAARGVESTLAAENRRMLGPVGTQANTALLVDPQTSGGLLAGVPNDSLDRCLASLAAAGIPAVVVGRVVQPAAAGAFPLRLDRADPAQPDPSRPA